MKKLKPMLMNAIRDSLKTVVIAFISSVLLVVSINGAQHSYFREILPGGLHQEGGARWEDELVNVTTRAEGCARYFKKEAVREDPSDCIVAQVHIKSHVLLVMDCRMTVERDRPDDSGRTLIETQQLIGPGEDRWGAHSFGPTGLLVKRFTTHCVTLPLEPTNVVNERIDCDTVVRESPYQDYPRGLLRMRLEGRTVIEYTAAETGRMEDIKIVGSSGSAFVDEAAVKSANRMKVRTKCFGVRFRHTITFRLPDVKQMVERAVE